MNWTNSRLDSTNQGNTINPNYTSNLIAQLTQPLLRNRGIDTNRQSLITAEINRRLADVSLRSTTINTVANTRNAYWDLVYAVQAVDAARQSLALAQKLVEDNKSRVEIGTMAPIDVVSAQSEAAARQLALVQAVATRQTTEITLKRLLVAGTTDPLWNATLNPTDRPHDRERQDRRRVRSAQGPYRAHGPDPGAREPEDQRRVDEVPAQPDADGPRPDGFLRGRRDGRARWPLDCRAAG